jgi:PmbA protein
MRLAERLGADETEVYISLEEEKGLSFVDRVESTDSSLSTGLGVRIVKDKKVGLSATTALRRREAEEAVKRAFSMARVARPIEDWVSLPTRFGRTAVQGIFDGETAWLAPETIAKTALEMLKTVHARGKNLSVTRGEVSVGVEKTLIASSHGGDLEREESFTSAFVSVKAEDGEKKGLSSESSEAHDWGAIDFAGLCERASERACKAMEARQIPGGDMPVLWRNKLFASIMRIMFGSTLTAEAVQKRRSPWRGKVGTVVADERLSLVDEGLLAKGMGTREFDDEGVPQQRTCLLDCGILRGFLYDTFTGNKDHVKSTGNASRSYARAPTPAPNNLMVTPGKASFESMIGETKRGFYVDDVIGLWLSNPVSGNLSATATNAYLVEDGALTQPVKGMLLSGNFFEILKKGIDSIGSDMDYDGDAYSPSVRVLGMTLTRA